MYVWETKVNDMTKQGKTGRKQLPKGEKKIGVSLYIQENTVKKYGGRTKLAEKILNECEFLNQNQ